MHAQDYIGIGFETFDLAYAIFTTWKESYIIHPQQIKGSWVLFVGDKKAAPISKEGIKALASIIENMPTSNEPEKNLKLLAERLIKVSKEIECQKIQDLLAEIDKLFNGNASHSQCADCLWEGWNKLSQLISAN
jgi:hypothetical protein